MSEQQQQTKQDRPRTRGNQRPQQQRGGNQNKQNRGGYRAKDNEEKRPQTEGNNRNRNNNRGGPNNRGNNNRNDRGGRQRREENPESWAYRYRHDERPKYEHGEVTKDTVIPDVPAKADRLKQPSQEAFTKKMEEYESQVRQKRDQIRNIIKKKNEIIEGGKIGNTSVTYKQALNDKLAVMKTVIAKKRELQNEINNLNADINVFEGEKNKLKKSMHKDYKSLDEIKDAIKSIESRLETTSLSMQEEKKLIRELDTLKNSVPAAERFAAIKPEVKKLMDRRNEVYGDLKKVREEVNDVQAEIEALRKELDVVREGQNDQKEVLDDLSSKIDTLNDEITSIYKQKDGARDEYFHAKFDYECQQNLLRHVDWLTKQKDWVIKQEQEQRDRVEEQKQAMLNRPNPFYKEIEYVDHLVNYCHKLQVDAGLVQDSEVVARETQKDLLREMNREEFNKKISDGKLQIADSKQDRQAQGMMQVGQQGKKRKGKKPKAKDVAEDVFNIDIVVVQKFGFLKVSPPIAPEDLEDKIKELNDKKKYYLTEGERILNEEEEEFKKSLEAPVTETVQEEETKETADNAEERPRNNNRGGRGGYGRGGRGNNRGNRGGYGASRPIRSQRQEFEGSDDEEEERKEQRPKPKQRNQNKKFNAEDEENFPTF